MDNTQKVAEESNPIEGHGTVRNCTLRRCVTYSVGILNCNPEFSSKPTGKSFHVTEDVDCKPSFCVYILRCRKPGCEMQYVGQTICTVDKRMSAHKSSIRNS